MNRKIAWSISAMLAIVLIGCFPQRGARDNPFDTGAANYSNASAPAVLGTQYGDGSDSNIIIRSGFTVYVDELFNNNNVTGVTTHRGTDKGLNHGAGAYQPKTGAYIQAATFIVESGATLTAYKHKTDGGATNEAYGIVWIAARVSFTNLGTIDLNGKGYNGELKATSGGYSATGSGKGGPGYSQWSTDHGNTTGGSAGSSCGSSALPADTGWDTLFGSGGGGGGNFFSADNGGRGGDGGGAVRIYAAVFDTSTGVIQCGGLDGAKGVSYDNGGYVATGCGGGGAGGSIYIESTNAKLGPSRMSCAGGNGTNYYTDGVHIMANYTTGCGGGGGGGHRNAGGSGSDGGKLGDSTGPGSAGGNGSVGRIHVVGTYTGSTATPPIE